MKQLVLSVILAFVGMGLFAQKIDKAKELLDTKKNPAEAKTEIDKVLATDKGSKDPEAWFLKARIYYALGTDANLKAANPTAREESFEAVKKYVELENAREKDSLKRYISLQVNNFQPLTGLYSSYSNDGAAFYNAQNFNGALENYKKTMGIFDYMAGKNWTGKSKFDTTITLYAAITAEKANKPDDAAVYYGMIAENKIKSEGYVDIYKWLADHYSKKGDMANATKFVKLGKEVYPEDTFWSAFEIEMIRDKGTKEQLFAKYDEIIKEQPNNHVYYFNYGVELYQTAYDNDETKRPPNSKELIDKSREMLNKSIQLKPDYANAQMLLGQIAYNQGVDLNKLQGAIKGTPTKKLTPEETKKKDELKKQMVAKFDEAIPYFEKVDQLLGTQGKLKMEEKSVLKDAYDLLATIYEIKGDKDKTTTWSEKFADVDKKH
jgi:hypothetical protein